MADTLSVPRQRSLPQAVPGSSSTQAAETLANRRLPTPSLAAQEARNGHVSLRTFSPVNQAGSFVFDQVLKAGDVLKRNRRTKTWKTIHLVLRPNLLSIYKDAQENQLRHQLTLSDITAVVLQRDRKRADNAGAFGLFSPSRNFHFEASTETDAKEWVELIRREARLDAEEEEIMSSSSGPAKTRYIGFCRPGVSSQREVTGSSRPRGSTSSSEADSQVLYGMSRIQPRRSTTGRQVSHTYEYSGNEQASFSDFSDTQGLDAARDSPPPSSFGGPVPPAGLHHTQGTIYPTGGAFEAHNASQMSGIEDPERVVWQGHLYYLKSNRGVRQWRRCWVVLRSKNLALYKNEEEYAASLIIPISSVLDAVEIDPISKSKQYCMQIIAEDRSYRLCAADEGDLSKWLGGLKSVLARRKDAIAQRS